MPEMAVAPVVCRRTLHGAVLAHEGRTLFVVYHRGRFYLMDDVRRSLGASYDSRRKAIEAARSRLLREAEA
jgi:hypothetical protein